MLLNEYTVLFFCTNCTPTWKERRNCADNPSATKTPKQTVTDFEWVIEAQLGHDSDKVIFLLSLKETNTMITIGKLTLRALTMGQKLYYQSYAYQPHAAGTRSRLVKKNLDLTWINSFV